MVEEGAKRLPPSSFKILFTAEPLNIPKPNHKHNPKTNPAPTLYKHEKSLYPH
jgi:hypothetical protein